MSNSTNKKNVKKIGDQYLLLMNEELGRGATGKVFHGYRINDYTPVAIKVLNINSIECKKQVEKSIDLEMNLARKINHENIVLLRDVKVIKRNMYLVMDYCKGGDLCKFMNNQALPNAIVKCLIKDLARGLKVLFEHDIIHRDLKPANLLLDKVSTINETNPNDTSNIGVLKIADFGFAKEIRKGDLTKTIAGSPSYMAPEILNMQPYSYKVDLWSVGVILYELVYGRLPWIADSIIELIAMQQKEPLYLPNVDPLVINLIKGLLMVNPEQRFSFEEFYSHPYVQDNDHSIDIPLCSTDILPIDQMISISKTGMVLYPDIVFNSVFDEFQQNAMLVWAIAEAGYLYYIQGKNEESICLFIRSLQLLCYMKDTIRADTSKMKIMEKWIRQRYKEFDQWIEKISLKIISKTKVLNTEDILYVYAIQLAKQATYHEYIYNVKESIMYKRSKLILEYLIKECNYNDTILHDCINYINMRL
jgi:serine/threonine protein kinase